MLMTGIPPQVAPGAVATAELDLTRPDIFFGTRQQRYAVVSPETGEYAAPMGAQASPGSTSRRASSSPPGCARAPGLELQRSEPLHCGGDHGVEPFHLPATRPSSAPWPSPRSSASRRTRIPSSRTGESIGCWRASPGTSAYPLASAADFGAVRRSRVRYVRNSVKVTVDAVTGRVDFYRVPDRGPARRRIRTCLPRAVEAHGRDAFRDSRAPAVSALADEASRAACCSSTTRRRLLRSMVSKTSGTSLRSSPKGTTPVPYRPEYGLYARAG